MIPEPPDNWIQLGKFLGWLTLIDIAVVIGLAVAFHH
jgi:hypothetical protein